MQTNIIFLKKKLIKSIWTHQTVKKKLLFFDLTLKRALFYHWKLCLCRNIDCMVSKSHSKPFKKGRREKKDY